MPPLLMESKSRYEITASQCCESPSRGDSPNAKEEEEKRRLCSHVWRTMSETQIAEFADTSVFQPSRLLIQADRCVISRPANPCQFETGTSMKLRRRINKLHYTLERLETERQFSARRVQRMYRTVQKLLSSKINL